MTEHQVPGAEPPALPRTVWLETAAPAAPAHPLSGQAIADVVVIGAGFTGLTAAIDLARAGRRVIVVDATEPGWGASGRNNGQVIPGLKLDPDALERRHGSEQGKQLVVWGGAAPDVVFDLIAEHAIACHPVRHGWIQPAYTTKALPEIASRCEQWALRSAPVEMLPVDALPEILGTPAYVGAWIDRRGGTLNPLAYARGLADIATRNGARLCMRTPALSLERAAGRWTLRTPDGAIRADQVIVATAGYSDTLVAGLARSIVPVRTAQVASAPLSDKARRTILPGGQGASDTRRLLTSFRLSPDHRLVMGGSGATGTLDHTALLPRLHRAAAELFAHLGPLDWQFGWSGYFAVTSDHLPHFHESTDGLVCALGCNGRGIAVSTAMGRLVAARITGAAVESLPLRPVPMARVAFHEFRDIGIALATAAKGWQDRHDRRQTLRRALH